MSLSSTNPYKFGRWPKEHLKPNGLPNRPEDEPFRHENKFAQQGGNDWNRLCIGFSGSSLELSKSLVQKTSNDFDLLYVLKVQRGDVKTGRYEACSLSAEYMWSLLDRYKGLIENDGRHELWIRDYAQKETFVIDEHEILYAYGDLPRFITSLTKQGFEESITETPTPHAHHYYPEYDHPSRSFLEELEWKHTPLKEEDKS